MNNRIKFLGACFFASLAINAYAGVASESRPIVEIKNGKLQGIESKGMIAFKDIPYAAPRY